MGQDLHSDDEKAVHQDPDVVAEPDIPVRPLDSPLLDPKTD